MKEPRLDINAFAAAVHENAVRHGWWENPPTFPEIVALCHCELSEALQIYRESDDEAGDGMLRMCGKCKHTQMCRENGVVLDNAKCAPGGIAVEMIDCMLRIMDWLAAEGIDVEAVLRAKHTYNKGRPYRHGGKKI